MTAQDTNRGTSGVSLPVEVAKEVWTRAIDESAIMKLAKKLELPGSGIGVDLITADPVAYTVAEADEITVSDPALSNKVLRGYKFGVIVPFSNEFKRDKSRLYEQIVEKLPAALGRKFDKCCFGFDNAPGADFDTLASVSTSSLASSVYDNIVAADAAIATNGGELNGWIMAPKMRTTLLGVKDDEGRPIFIPSVHEGQVGALLGVPTTKCKHAYKAGAAATSTPEVLGFAGDWTSAFWGRVGDVKMSVSDQSSLTIGDSVINLWQRDMFAVKFTFETGFRTADSGDFIKLTGSTPS